MFDQNFSENAQNAVAAIASIAIVLTGFFAFINV